MAKLKFPEPLTCSQVRALSSAVLAGHIDAERRGRVEGHLLGCEECSVAFAEEISRAFAAGTLAGQTVPPAPAFLDVLAPAALAQRGIVKGWRLQAVQHEAARAAGMAQREAKRLLQSFHEWCQAALPLWQAAPPAEVFAHNFDETAAAENQGRAPLQHLDDAWQPRGVETLVDVEEGPLITTGGAFVLGVAGSDKLAGQRLVCSLHLIDEEAIRFETPLQAAPDGTWTARFYVEGLPAAREDVPIALEFIQLYAVPLEPGGGT